MAFLTIHHWDAEVERGVRELRRVARGPVVIATCDPRVSGDIWLMRDYLPEVAELDMRIFPLPEQLCEWLGDDSQIEVVPIARDTPDWTLMSFWAHPERVLDDGARNATRAARMAPAVVARVVAAVRRDLASGEWERKNASLRALTEFDAGLRLVIGRPRG